MDKRVSVTIQKETLEILNYLKFSLGLDSIDELIQMFLYGIQVEALRLACQHVGEVRPFTEWVEIMGKEPISDAARAIFVRLLKPVKADLLTIHKDPETEEVCRVIAKPITLPIHPHVHDKIIEIK